MVAAFLLIVRHFLFELLLLLWGELLGRDVTMEQIAYAQQLLFTEIENCSVRQTTLAEVDSVLMFVPRLEADRAVAAGIAKSKQPPSLSMMIVMGTLSGLIFSGLFA